MRKPETKKINTTTWKSLALIFAVCFVLAVPPLAAQDSGQQGYKGQQGQQDYKGQQGQKDYKGQQGQQGQKGQQEYDYQEPSQQQSKNFSEGELEKFAAAKVELDDIRSEYSKELENVSEADQARKLQDKYGQQMIESIRDEGLSVEKYNKISQAMQTDAELRKKIENLGE